MEIALDIKYCGGCHSNSVFHKGKCTTCALTAEISELTGDEVEIRLHQFIAEIAHITGLLFGAYDVNEKFTEDNITCARLYRICELLKLEKEVKNG